MEKFIKWLKATGLSNLGLIAAAVLCLILKPIFWYEASIVCATIFVKINWDIIRKLVTNKLK